LSRLPPAAFFIVEPNQKQLVEVASNLMPDIFEHSSKLPVALNEASAAYTRAVRNKGGYGKIAIAVPA
jgi:hypothetical protein